MCGVSFPKETEFCSLGAGVHTTDSVASGQLILKRIGKASALLDRIHGVQGETCCGIKSKHLTCVCVCVMYVYTSVCVQMPCCSVPCPLSTVAICPSCCVLCV